MLLFKVKLLWIWYLNNITAFTTSLYTEYAYSAIRFCLYTHSYFCPWEDERANTWQMLSHLA